MHFHSLMAEAAGKQDLAVRPLATAFVGAESSPLKIGEF